MRNGSAGPGEKVRLLIPMLLHDRVQLRDRLRTIVESRLDRVLSHPGRYRPSDLQEALAAMGPSLGVDAAAFLREPALEQIADEVQDAIASGRADGPFGKFLNADPALARLCYAVTRALRPAVALETGVGYGMTSAYILQALQENGDGVLHSVDLAPLVAGSQSFVGSLIPVRLRGRWRLHAGGSRSVLPPLLPSIGPVEVFVHDSAHTYWHMAWELQTVRAHAASPCAILSDDVEGNRAFQEFAEREGPAFWAAVREVEKASLCGVSVFR